MEFTKFRYLALLINAAGVLACNFHTSNHVSHPHLGKRQLIRRAEREVLDWDYANSADWHTIQPGKDNPTSTYIYFGHTMSADTS